MKTLGEKPSLLAVCLLNNLPKTFQFIFIPAGNRVLKSDLKGGGVVRIYMYIHVCMYEQIAFIRYRR